MIDFADKVPDPPALTLRSATGLSAACQGPDLMYVPSIINYISRFSWKLNPTVCRNRPSIRGPFGFLGAVVVKYLTR